MKQHFGERKQRKKENLVCMMWPNFTFIILDGETETAETIAEANMTAGLLQMISLIKNAIKLQGCTGCYYTLETKFQH